jgi:hypothetical protein
MTCGMGAADRSCMPLGHSAAVSPLCSPCVPSVHHPGQHRRSVALVQAPHQHYARGL